MNTERLPDDAIGTGEASRLIGVSIQTIGVWIERGKIRGWRVGERKIVSKAEVEGMVVQITPRRDDAPRTEAEQKRAAAAAKQRMAERRAGRTRRQKV